MDDSDLPDYDEFVKGINQNRTFNSGDKPLQGGAPREFNSTLKDRRNHLNPPRPNRSSPPRSNRLSPSRPNRLIPPHRGYHLTSTPFRMHPRHLPSKAAILDYYVRYGHNPRAIRDYLATLRAQLRPRRLYYDRSNFRRLFREMRCSSRCR